MSYVPCVNALTRALSISTVPLKMTIEIKAFWALFCRYFSEYSEKYLFCPLFLAVHSLFIILRRNGYLFEYIVSCPPPIDNPILTARICSSCLESAPSVPQQSQTASSCPLDCLSCRPGRSQARIPQECDRFPPLPVNH